MTKHSVSLSFVLGLLPACGGTVDVGLGTGRLAVGSHAGSTDGGASSTVSCGTLDDRTCQSTPECVYVAGAPCGTRVDGGTTLASSCRGLSLQACGTASGCAWDPYSEGCFLNCMGFDDTKCQSTDGCIYIPGAPCATRVPMSIIPSLNCSSLDDATCGQTSSCVVVPGNPCGTSVALPGCDGLEELTCRTDPNCYYVWGLGCLGHNDPCSALPIPSTCQSTTGCAYLISIGCYSTPAGSPTDAGAE